MPPAPKPWSLEEESVLIDEVNSGKFSQEEIAEKHGRTGRSIANRMDILRGQQRIGKKVRTPAEQAKTSQREPLTKDDLFRYLKNHPRTLEEICARFDRSPATIRTVIDEMKAEGYHLVIAEDERHSIPIDVRPQVDTPAETIAGEPGMVVALGLFSELHAGSRFSQPSAWKKAHDIAYEEYGVRHFIHPGDMTAGLFGYRGQSEDLISAARSESIRTVFRATHNQIWLADAYTPRYPDAHHYLLGGNHDWWHVLACGVDPIRALCDRRPDFHYMGYDAAALPITDKVHVKLWHPNGGLPYAKSYRLQKGSEGLAYTTLREAIRHETSPFVQIIVSGHLHIAIYLPTSPIVGIHPGAFEGQTSLGARLGSEPDLGGTIIRMLMTERGHIQRLEFTWLNFEEISDDWTNWRTPNDPSASQSYEAERLDLLYSFDAINPGDRFPKDTASLDMRVGTEYVGGKA